MSFLNRLLVVVARVPSRTRSRSYCTFQQPVRRSVGIINDLSPAKSQLAGVHLGTTASSSAIGTVRSILSDAVQKRLALLMDRHKELTDEMKSAGHTSNKVAQEFASLSPMASLLEQKHALEVEAKSIEELLADEDVANDLDMQTECQRDMERIEQNLAILDEKLVGAVLPQDEDDFRADAIIEIRAGTGGDEASLFANELVESYSKIAKSLRWKVEVLSVARTDIGGIREASISVSGGATFEVPSNSNSRSPIDYLGDDASASDAGNVGAEPALLGPYGTFKYESGVHRVQRVPVNDSRIHTSACSVAVLPSSSARDAASDKSLLPTTELKIETMRSSGAGGQHVNTTDSAVRITHLPTGITASIQDERSQHKNKEKALKLIAARVRDQYRVEEEQKLGETRSSLMGGGDRSERIRTYNFPQDRITDHRCKESRHGINSLLNGGAADNSVVVTFLPYLQSLRRDELLEALESK